MTKSILSEEQQSNMVNRLEAKFKEILDILDLENRGLSKEHLVDTPRRISKMYVYELFKGCYTNPPKITTFNLSEEEQKNVSPVTLNRIQIKSVCSHHFVPFAGSCVIQYLPRKTIVGISKLARIADYFSRFPQVQENLTNQIGNYIMSVLDPQYCAIVIKAKHLCISHRGANEPNTEMITCYFKDATDFVPAVFDKQIILESLTKLLI